MREAHVERGILISCMQRESTAGSWMTGFWLILKTSVLHLDTLQLGGDVTSIYLYGTQINGLQDCRRDIEIGQVSSRSTCSRRFREKPEFIWRILKSHLDPYHWYIHGTEIDGLDGELWWVCAEILAATSGSASYWYTTRTSALMIIALWNHSLTRCKW
jgi:hypothetical protein